MCFESGDDRKAKAVYHFFAIVFRAECGCGEDGSARDAERIESFFDTAEYAIKYTPAGGSVAVELSQQDGHICCTVKDTGIGIPQEHQAHVFERFYRVDKSHSRQTGGTGLGMAIVKHVAEVHQAQLKLESKPQEGTTVSVLFH